MKHLLKRTLACLLGCAVLAAPVTIAAGEDTTPLLNPGFEEQNAGWAWGNKEVTISSEAARTGKAGMRIHVEDSLPTGTSVTSSAIAVKPGQALTLRYWARSKDPTFLGVYVYFFGADGKRVTDASRKATGGGSMSVLKGPADDWQECKLETTVPAGAATVSLWIHSWGGAKGLIDFDDFLFTGFEPGAAATPPAPARPVKTEDTSAPDLSKLPPRSAPPVIILKLDDLRPIKGQLHGIWKNLDAYLAGKKIKYSLGVICQDLAQSSPEMIEWVKTRQQSGAVEFWFHAWDHQAHKEGNANPSEFAGRSYEDQLKRFTDGQTVAKETFGFNFATFGPPGGGDKHYDAATFRVMADEPNMKVWLYPNPINKEGQALQDAGKVTILDRVWAVNLEATVGVPDCNRLIKGYAANPERAYFVLQGHPMAWGNGPRFEEFKKIIDFLVSQNAVFMTPSEYAATQKSAAK